MRIFAKAVFISAVVLCFLVAFNVAASDEWPDTPTADDILTNQGIREELDREWEASQSGDGDARHEEGGWIAWCREWCEEMGQWEYSLYIYGVSSGSRYGIDPGTPPDLGEDCLIIGFKHTHPNPPEDEDGNEWEQGPSEADKGWHERHGIPGIIVNADGTATTGPDSGIYE